MVCLQLHRIQIGFSYKVQLQYRIGMKETLSKTDSALKLRYFYPTLLSMKNHLFNVFLSQLVGEQSIKHRLAQICRRYYCIKCKDTINNFRTSMCKNRISIRSTPSHPQNDIAFIEIYQERSSKKRLVLSNINR